MFHVKLSSATFRAIPL